MLDGKQLTISEAHKLLKSRQISSVDLTKSALDRIEKLDSQVKAIVTVTADLAIEQPRKPMK